jgi:hypothetical protein
MKMKVRCVNANVGKVGKDNTKKVVPSLLQYGKEYEATVLDNGAQLLVQVNGEERKYRRDRFEEVSS